MQLTTLQRHIWQTKRLRLWNIFYKQKLEILNANVLRILSDFPLGFICTTSTIFGTTCITRPSPAEVHLSRTRCLYAISFSSSDLSWVPRERCIFDRTIHNFFWPHKTSKGHTTVKFCRSCAQERYRVRHKRRF